MQRLQVPRSFWALALVVASVLPLRAQGDAEPPGNLPTKAEIDTVMRGLADITGFRVRRQLPFQLVTREQVNQFLKDQIRKSVKPAEIRAEETTLRMFGFVPKDFDLKQNTIDLLTEQAAAYYDFQRRKLFISDWASRNMREVALVHELAHALADQNYPIRRFLAAAGDDAERSLARQTVVEGQASWLMIEYAARQAGKTLKEPATAAEYLKDQPDQAPGDTGDNQYPIFSKAPLYIRRTLMFPYDDGQRFQQVIYLKEGKSAFARVFTQPPASSAQIIHPDRYLERVDNLVPELPKRPAGVKELVHGTVGELDNHILLRQYIDQATADALAPKLRGGAFRIDEAKVKKRLTLTYISDWDSPEAAARYFTAYQKVLRGKSARLDAAKDTSTEFTGQTDAGYFSLTLAGNRVTAQEGAARSY